MKFKLEKFINIPKKRNTPPDQGKPKPLKDCFGIRFSSIRQFLRFYCIDQSRFCGWSKTYRKKHHLKTIVFDDTSTEMIINRFANLELMEKRLAGYLKRRTSPSFASRENRTDHKGIVYKSISAMCRSYGVLFETYRHRRVMGWSKEDALTKSPQKPVPPAIRKAREGQNGSENNDS